MKKFLLLFLLLTLAACGNQDDEITRLESEVIRLSEEYNRLHKIINEQAQEIVNLQELLTESEQYDARILESFRKNLDDVANFLGIYDLYIADEDITKLGNIVTAHTTVTGGGVHLTFRYWVWGDEIRWILLEYGIGPLYGPGKLDAGRSMWQWQQADLFSENFEMRFFRFSDFNDYEYFDAEIEYHNWQQQVISHMQTHSGIQIADLWYEESRIVVDLKPAGVVFFNWGSFGGAMRKLSLIESIATLPNITEIEVLVGGQRGVGADHFSFAGVFRVE